MFNYVYYFEIKHGVFKLVTLLVVIFTTGCNNWQKIGEINLIVRP